MQIPRSVYKWYFFFAQGLYFFRDEEHQLPRKIPCLTTKHIASYSLTKASNFISIHKYNHLTTYNEIYISFSMAQQPPLVQGVFTVEVLQWHADTTHSLGLLRTSDQSEAVTSTTLTTDIRSRVQKFPTWHTKAAQNGKCCEGYIVPSMVRLMYQLRKCVEIKGDYVEKWQRCFISVTLKSWSGRTLLDPTKYRHPCPRQDSKPQSQQASDRRPTPLTARHWDRRGTVIPNFIFLKN